MSKLVLAVTAKSKRLVLETRSTYEAMAVLLAAVVVVVVVVVYWPAGGVTISLF